MLNFLENIGKYQNKGESPANIYLFKVNNKNNTSRCEICSKLIMKILERHLTSFWCFIVNFKHISQLFLVFPLLTLSRFIPARLLVPSNNRKTGRCEICSKLTIKTLNDVWRRSDVFIVNFKDISHFFLMFHLIIII